MQVADLRDERDGRDELDSPQRLKRRDDRREWPVCDRLFEHLLQALALRFQLLDALFVFLINALLVGKDKALIRKPAPMQLAPYGFSRKTAIMPQQEALQRVLR